MKCSQISSTNKFGFTIIISTIILLITIMVCISFGSVHIPFKEIFAVILGERESSFALILLYVRLPRIFAALFAGAGLAVAGMIIQSLLNNPLAGPNIIGVNAGAGFFAVLCYAFLPTATKLVPIAAFIGALLSMLTVYGVAKKTGASRMTIVLAGIAVNSFLNAASDAVHTLVPDALIGSTAFRIGGLSSISADNLWLACIMIAVALVAAFLLRNELDILALGDEIAASLGLSVRLYRFLLLVIASCLAGASVSFAGLIGFVGLIIPHCARYLVGSESRKLLPISAILGAFMLLVCDLISRTVFAPYELPVGIILSFLGAPFFIWLLIHKKGGHRHD